MDDAAAANQLNEIDAGADRVSPSDRTKVILLSQVVAIVALLVVWSIIRSRQAAARSTATS